MTKLMLKFLKSAACSPVGNAMLRIEMLSNENFVHH